MENQVKETAKESNSFGLMTRWKVNIVTDVEAPQLFSRQVINAFSILFSVLFGGILLAINLKNIGCKRGVYVVLGYSFAYLSLMIIILNQIEKPVSSLTLGFNLLGAIPLYNYFWWKYIGKETNYRTKPFWLPLIVGILISSFILFTIIAGGAL